MTRKFLPSLFRICGVATFVPLALGSTPTLAQSVSPPCACAACSLTELSARIALDVDTDLVYQALLRRRAEPQGLQYWFERRAHGMSRADFIRKVLESEEYRAANP